MFDRSPRDSPAVAPIHAELVSGWVRGLAETDGPDDDAGRVDLIRALEELKNAAAGLQAEVSAALDRSQRAEQAAQGLPAGRQGRGVAAQVALARRESPHRGAQHLALAKVLRAELPHTYAALRQGLVSEWRATLLARETACLELADRVSIDRELAEIPERLARLGDGELVAAARSLAYQRDPASFVERRRRAEADRRVSLRPAPDTMACLTALLPVAQGVAVVAALKQYADSALAGGDPRGRGQLMADALVERVVPGAKQVVEPGEAGSIRPPVVPVTVNVVITDGALLGEDDAAAFARDHGPVPADLVRHWVSEGLYADVEVELRRLYAAPDTGQLVAMESRARRFPRALGLFIDLRDQRCRTPWCDAPIRHRDHVVDYDRAGPTSAANSQGLCEACNHAKQAPGWRASPLALPERPVRTTTPTGHRYVSVTPPAKPPARSRSTVEYYLAELLWAS